MRHISLDNIYIPEEWEDYANELLANLRGMKDDERSATLRTDTEYQIWTLLKPILQGISHGKCFYTEVKIGSSGEIDHFRPKARIENCDLPKSTEHKGYWWLAYLIKNFRYCKHTVNRKKTCMFTGKVYGKGNRFPIFKHEDRATKEATDWTKEQAMLLDPTNPDDVKLLRFEDTGKPVSSNPDKTSLEYQRVEVSIQCYSLDGDEEINNRRGDICTKAKDKAFRLVNLEKKRKEGKPYNKRDLIKYKAELHEMVQPYAEFSSAVRCVLLQYRTSDSIKKILGLK